MRRILRDNGLTLATFGLFLLIWIAGQTWSGMRVYNEEQAAHGEPSVDYLEYLTTAHFGEATSENWESEFLQMGFYVLLTVWLRQKGSAESKQLEGSEDVDEDPANHRDDPGAPGPVRRGGLALRVYQHSLSIVLFGLFLASFFVHAITGARLYNQEQLAHGESPLSTLAFLGRAQFWFESFQNWQSEFLAVGAIVALTIFLRQRGSPESKPVHAPHAQTGSS